MLSFPNMAAGANFSHYKQHAAGAELLETEQVLHFESFLTDNEVRTAISPIPVTRFERNQHESRSHIVARSADVPALSDRLRDLGRQRYAELAPVWEAEREARFQEYYCSLKFEGSVSPYS